MLLITAQPIRNLRTPASADMNKRGFLEQASPPPLPNPPPLFPFLPIPYPLPPTPFDACYAGYDLFAAWTNRLAFLDFGGQKESEITQMIFKFADILDILHPCLNLIIHISEESAYNTF